MPLLCMWSALVFGAQHNACSLGGVLLYMRGRRRPLYKALADDALATCRMTARRGLHAANDINVRCILAAVMPRRVDGACSVCLHAKNPKKMGYRMGKQTAH